MTALGDPGSKEPTGSARTSPSMQNIQSKTTTSRGRLGFSLVETIVVASLLSTILLFAMGLIPSFKLSNKRASTEFQASTIAQSTLEAARSANFPSIADSSRTVVVNGITFQEETKVTPSPTGLAKTVRVTVKWAWRGGQHELFRESVICRVPRG